MVRLKNKKKRNIHIEHKVEVRESMDWRQKRFIETLKMVAKVVERRGGRRRM